jgi:hypothetical protein
MVDTKTANRRLRRVVNRVRGRRHPMHTKKLNFKPMGMSDATKSFNDALSSMSADVDRIRKRRLLRDSYKAYLIDQKKNGVAPKHPKSSKQLISTIMPYMSQAAGMQAGSGDFDVYSLIPSLSGAAGSAFGVEGKIIGEIGGQVVAEFIRWGIEEDGFKELVNVAEDIIDGVIDFAEDAASEIGSFLGDVVSDAGGIISDAVSDVGSILSDIF